MPKPVFLFGGAFTVCAIADAIMSGSVLSWFLGIGAGVLLLLLVWSSRET